MYLIDLHAPRSAHALFPGARSCRCAATLTTQNTGADDARTCMGCSTLWDLRRSASRSYRTLPVIQRMQPIQIKRTTKHQNYMHKEAYIQKKSKVKLV
jgi:hypothetical protein